MSASVLVFGAASQGHELLGNALLDLLAGRLRLGVWRRSAVRGEALRFNPQNVGS